MLKRILGAMIAVVCIAASSAYAQSYPTKPVTMIVPFAAGGPTDTLARNLGKAMSKSLNKQIIVDNRAGAGGTLGVGLAAKAKPDGYTVVLAHIGMSTAPALYRKLSYNPLTDFEYIGQVADVPMTMLGKKGLPPNDLKELLPYIKANKAKLNYANAGLGAASHLCGLMFMSALEADMQTISYKGTAPAMTDLLGGQVDLMCDQTTNTTGQIQAGTVKVYGVTSAKRVPSLPNVPTLQEQGMKGFEVVVWHGIYAPKGTPKAALDALNAALKAAVQDPEFKEAIAKLGAEAVPVSKVTAESLHAQLKAETEKWGPVIKAAGVYAD